MKCIPVIVLLIVLAKPMLGQNTVFDDNIRTLRVTLDDDPLLPPVLRLGKSSHLNISWDEMSHGYHHYTYRVQHCSRDWQPTADLFESDFLYGNNDLPVEDYETSFNTTQIYTHYSLQFPNRDMAPLLSGNYRMLIYEDGRDETDPSMELRFRVVEQEMILSMQVTSNTDIDFNDFHQQVSLNLNYGTLPVIDPYSQIHAVVIQNQRPSRTVAGITPDINKASGLEWKHCEDYIFPAGNEYHKFEILNVNHSGMNVDHMRWFEPYYHATLWQDNVPLNYLSEKEHNGIFIPRTEDREGDDTQAEYVIVHFSLCSPLLDEDVYVSGQWSNGEMSPDCLMHYDEEAECYEAAVLLKQGYYEYQYITQGGDTKLTMGDFWQTDNEYQAFIYYREIGGRYDRIVAYANVNTAF